MLLKHWIIRDEDNQTIRIRFQEPSYNHTFNTFLKFADKETLRYLRNAEMPVGWKFQAKYINIAISETGHRLDLRMKRFFPYTEYFYVEFFQQLIGEYLDELEKTGD